MLLVVLVLVVVVLVVIWLLQVCSSVLPTWLS
jgi:hypothetical protein